MYIPKLLSKTLAQGVLTATVEFVDGEERVKKTYTTNSAGTNWLKGNVLQTLRELEALKLLDASLTVGNIDTTEAPPTIAPPRTQDQIDRAKYADDMETMRHLAEGVRLGIFTGNEAQIANLKTSLKASFKADYLDLF